MNGQLHVPDLSHLTQKDPATWMQGMILDGAGITPGGNAVVDCIDGTVYTLQDVELVVMAMPPMLHIMLTGRRTAVGGGGGDAIVIPWHAVTGLHTAP